MPCPRDIPFGSIVRLLVALSTVMVSWRLSLEGIKPPLCATPLVLGLPCASQQLLGR
jgi:hypothetical protein